MPWVRICRDRRIGTYIGPKNIGIVLRFRKLDRINRLHLHQIRLQTPRGGRLITISTTPGNRRGGMYVGFANNNIAPCARADFRVDYLAETVRLAFPRSCIGNAATVRSGARTTLDNGTGTRIWFDDAAAPAVPTLAISPLAARSFFVRAPHVLETRDTLPRIRVCRDEHVIPPRCRHARCVKPRPPGMQAGL